MRREHIKYLSPQFILPYIRVIFLKRFYPRFALPEGDNPFGGSTSGGNSSIIQHLVLDDRLSDIGIVILAGSAEVRVDDELNLPVLDGIIDIGPAFLKLLDQIRVHTIDSQEIMGPFCGEDVAYLRDQRDCARCPGIGLQHKNRIVSKGM